MQSLLFLFFFFSKNNKKAETEASFEPALDTEAPAESFFFTNPLRQR